MLKELAWACPLLELTRVVIQAKVFTCCKGSIPDRREKTVRRF